jgi:recombination protein RecT
MVQNQSATNSEHAVATQPASQNATALKKKQEDVSTQVLDRVSEMEQAGALVLPKGYHAGNALKSAWLYLQNIEDRNHNKAIDTCTKASIANVLLEMVIRGEHPMKHCYFIPYGNQLTFMEKYTGKLMRSKRDTEIAEVNANVVREGEEFVYTVDKKGLLQLVSHKPTFQTMGKPIVGAYAVVVNKDGSTHLEVMTMDMIQKAWNQGGFGDKDRQTGAHKNFTDQMCKKTVIARACKVALESSSDRDEDNEEDLGFVPMQPQQQEIESKSQPHPKTIEHHDTFEESASYEEVREAEPNYPEINETKPQAEHKRECPI